MANSIEEDLDFSPAGHIYATHGLHAFAARSPPTLGRLGHRFHRSTWRRYRWEAGSRLMSRRLRILQIPEGLTLDVVVALEYVAIL
jgi:hypothetical protein